MSAAKHTPGPWHVFAETFRGKQCFVVKRSVGRGTEYMLSERTERKTRYFDASIAQRHADEANRAAIAKATGGQQ